MRNVKDWYLFLDRLIRCGKQLYLYLEQKFYETEDGLIAGIKAILAEDYSRELSKKINNAHRNRQEKGGKVILTSKTFGFHKEKDCRVSIVEEEAEMVSGRLGEKLPLADSNPETANFTQGIMVLPVEYTKGLEFDGVLLYHPSAEHYPAEDRYVKLLYVAATRALHELTVVHQGDLTDLIARPVSGEKRMQLLEEEKKVQREKADRQQKRPEIRKPKAVHASEKRNDTEGSAQTPENGSGIDELVQTRKIFERNPAVRPLKKTENPDASAQQPVNTSLHRFGEIPQESILRPKGHSRIDCSVRILKKGKKYLEMISRYGILRLTPLTPEIIRVQFLKGTMGSFQEGYWNYQPDTLPSWSAKAGKTLVEIATENLIVRIDKRTGALQFCDRKGKLLLTEKADLPRQIETGSHSDTWTYFDWGKTEKIYAKGSLNEDLERMNQKARYISFGGRTMRMPLLISDKGYGIGITAEHSVICCTIPTYGNYVYTDGTDQIDYYFIYGGDSKNTLELYKKITG